MSELQEAKRNQHKHHGTVGLIDDTKGNGDTAYVWSADKVFDQLALKAFGVKTTTGTLAAGGTETFTEGNVYIANTDGFLIGTMLCTTASSVGVQKIEGFTDSSNPPTTLGGVASLTGHVSAQYSTGTGNSYCMPVNKGQYFKFTKTNTVGNMATTRTYEWIPSGN